MLRFYKCRLHINHGKWLSKIKNAIIKLFSCKTLLYTTSKTLSTFVTDFFWLYSLLFDTLYIAVGVLLSHSYTIIFDSSYSFYYR